MHDSRIYQIKIVCGPDYPDRVRDEEGESEFQKKSVLSFTTSTSRLSSSILSPLVLLSLSLSLSLNLNLFPLAPDPPLHDQDKYGLRLRGRDGKEM